LLFTYQSLAIILVFCIILGKNARLSALLLQLGPTTVLEEVKQNSQGPWETLRNKV